MWLSRAELERLNAELREIRRQMDRLESLLKPLEHIARHFQWPNEKGDVLPPSPDEEPTKK